MDEGLQKFIHAQFDDAQEILQSEGELTGLIPDGEARYQNMQFLAEGGQKKIFTCIDILSGRKIAYATAKENASHENQAKFIREARLTAHLEHPHIIPVYDSGKNDEEQPFFTMKLVSGRTFAEYLHEKHSLQSRIDILLKACEAVNFAHDKGIIHFDIKPDNIQVSDYGEVLLCDWGLAAIAYESCSGEILEDEVLKKVDFNQSIDAQFKGTVGYAAPEMWKSKTPRTLLCDLYSLGAVLYRILTGKDPEMKVDWEQNFESLSLRAVCKKAMHTEPEKRYENVAQLIVELKAWRNGFATAAENASFFKTLKLLVLRHRNVSLSILLSLAAIVLLSFLFVRSLKSKEETATKLATELQATEAQRLLLEDELTPQYLQQAFKAFKRREYDAALSLCEHVLRNRPDSKRARQIKGMIYFSQQKFAEAVPYLSGKLKSAALEYEDKTPLSLDDLIGVLVRLKRVEDDKYVYKALLSTELQKDITLQGKQRIMLAEMNFKNPHMQGKINFSLRESSEGLMIDLSNNLGIRDYWVLEKLGPVYVKKIDLSNTPSYNGWGWSEGLQIEHLVLRHWPGVEMEKLAGRRILHLDLQDSELDYGEIIGTNPLISLNIAGTPFERWSRLLTLEKLRHLTVSKGALPEDIKRELAKKVSIREL